MHLLSPPHEGTCWGFQKVFSNSGKRNTITSASSQWVTEFILWRCYNTSVLLKSVKPLIVSWCLLKHTTWPKQTGQMSICMLIFLTNFLNKQDLYNQCFISLPLLPLIVHLRQFQSNSKAEITVQCNQKSFFLTQLRSVRFFNYLLPLHCQITPCEYNFKVDITQPVSPSDSRTLRKGASTLGMRKKNYVKSWKYYISETHS